MTRQSNFVRTDYIFAGEDNILRFTVNDSNDVGASAVDITGWTVQFTMVDQIESPTVTVTKTVGSGITLTTPASGILDVAIDDVDTESLADSTYKYALKRLDAGFEQVLAFGDLPLIKGAIST